MGGLLKPDSALAFMSSNIELYQGICQLIRPVIANGRFRFWCDICEKITFATANQDWNLRNSILCASCRQGGRQRHTFKVIKEAHRKRSFNRKVILEEVTSFKKLLDQKFGVFFGSEYLGEDKVGGVRYPCDGLIIQHEDIQALSYETESIDLLITLDVLEHIPSIPRALSECNRILRPGGLFILTVPFYDQRNTNTRAAIVNGRLVNYSPQAFHGNPISKEGALVFTEPGVDLIASMVGAGFDVTLSLGANIYDGLLRRPPDIE
jgi:hypothetical protein